MFSIDSLLKSQLKFKGNFINGQWKKSARPSGGWECVSPSNIDWVLPGVTFSFDFVSEAIEAAKRAKAPWAKTGLHQRVELVRKFSKELAKRAEHIATLISLETGKPFSEALAETDLLQTKIQSTIEQGLALVKSQVIDLGIQGIGEIHYRPKGLFAVIGPFNLALSLPHGQMIPALLAGNVCIFKPSEKTPHSAQAYFEAVEATGFPPGVLQMIHGKGEMGIRLSREDVDGVMATCSFDVGTHIQKEMAEKPQRVVILEMGAKNAALVWKGAEIEATAEQLVKSAFMTTGQRCTALPRVYVDRALMPDLVKRVHEMAKNLTISHPFDEEPRPFMGSLISAQSKERFFRYMAFAEGEGADCVMRAKSLEGQSRLSRKPLPMGHYVTPSIHMLQRWDAKSAYQSHEIFGPDIFFCPVDTIDEGLAAINSTGYGLAASFFGKSEEDFKVFADQVESGLVYFNRGTVGSSSRLPFGGWKKSGNHRPGGLFAILSSTQVQSRLRAK